MPPYAGGPLESDCGERMRQIRIFLSSPGDVGKERDLARRIVKDLLTVDPFIRGKANLDIVSWDDPDAPTSLSAHLSPQEAIARGLPSPSACDIVVVILWSRIGTPVVAPDGSRYNSGTEFEYYDALKATRKDSGSIQGNGQLVRSILLYRRTEEPVVPLTASEDVRNEALAQWKSVQDFFAKFRSEDGSLIGGIHEYKTSQEFERFLISHLRNEISLILQEPSGPLQASEARTHDGAFYAPVFENAVLRTEALSALTERLDQSSVLVITGLSGNGKSFLAAQLAAKLRTDRTRPTLWIDCEKDESLESLLARLAHKAAFRAQTAKAQCKELLTYLKGSNSVLFLDDFQSCNMESMVPLLSLAAAQGRPALLVIVSRIVPDEALSLPGTVIHSVANFTKEEANALLAQRGLVGLGDSVVFELVKKTGALPLAMALFCGLMVLGANPRDLLSGDLIEAERLKKWFDELGRMLSRHATRLLGLLSLIDGPFDEPVAHMFLSGLMESDVRREFRSLNRVFLVERYDRSRWKVHDLVASIGRLSLAHSVVKNAHAALGRHYELLAREAEQAADQDAWFENMIRACRAYERSGERDDHLERALSAVAPAIKNRGAHVVFLELSRNLVGSRHVTDLWMHYHFAHCCFVLGLLDESLEYARRILQFATRRDATLRLAAARLYSESLASSGHLERAYESLNGALSAAKGQAISRTTLEQARSVLAGMEINLGKFELAHGRIQALIDETNEAQEPLGKAIALCRMGLLQLKLNIRDGAEQSFNDALVVFRNLRNFRGEAWALVGLAQVAFDAGDFDACARYLQTATPIQEQIGGYDPEYERVLQRMQAASTIPSLLKILTEEASRVAQAKVERSSFARRLRSLS